MIAAVGVSALAGPRQESWLKAIEKRVDATAKILGSMKTVKMTGLEQKMSTILQGLRSNEISKSEKFRQLLIIVVGFGRHLICLNSRTIRILLIIYFSIYKRIYIASHLFHYLGRHR